MKYSQLNNKEKHNRDTAIRSGFKQLLPRGITRISVSHRMSLGLNFLILNPEIKICPVFNFFFLFQLLPVFRFLVKSEKALYKFVCMCMSREFTNLKFY